MRVVQRPGDDRHQLHRLPERGAALPQSFRQVAPLDVSRDHVALALVGPAHVVDRDDVRVVELGEGTGLVEVGLDIRGAEDPVRVGHLDRHGTVEVVVPGEVDAAESPLA